jgi:hypothetical protein
MKQTINTASQFRDAFYKANRGEQFSYDALGLLFDYFEEIDPEMELDVIGICCDYEESTPADIMKSYSLENEDMVVDYVADNGFYIGTTEDGSIVYQQF